MDPTCIPPFVTSTRNVFATMMQLDPHAGEPSLRTSGGAEHDVSAVIELSGSVTGSVALGFPSDAAKRIVALLTGQELDLDDPDFADAIGELAAMVAGSAKAMLPGNISMSLPSVVTGERPGALGAPCVVIPCSSDCGDLAVELALSLAATPTAAST